MTNWILSRFVRDQTNASDTSARNALGKVASAVGIFCNLLLFLCKILFGTLSGSVSITADAVNNLSDASSSIISLLGFKMAGRPADEEHPYGHGRYEYLSGLTVSLLILVIGIELFRGSIEKILVPTPVEFYWASIAVLAVSIAVKLWMAGFNRTVGLRIGSQTLIATAADSRNDVISTSAVLIASLISHFASVELDGWMGLAVAGFILYSGFGLVRDTLDPLLGKAPDPRLVSEIKKQILGYPHVLGTHDLMIHDYGPGRQFGSVHVEMPAEMDVLVSHDVIDRIERDFLKSGLHMIIHFDPILTESAAVDDLRRWIAEQVKLVHPALSIHDLRVAPGSTHTNIIFDCVVPHALGMKYSELKAQINQLVAAQYPAHYCVITIDTNYAALPH